MKFLSKVTAAIFGSALLLSAVPATAQVSSIDDLLRDVQTNAEKVRRENDQRVREFRQKANQQSSTLDAAKRELQQLQNQAAAVERSFAGNTRRIEQLKDQLDAELGEFDEVFGLAKGKAGEFKALLDSSLTTAEDPTRANTMGRVAQSKALPSSEELDDIWKTMLQEIKYQREIKKFEAPVANIEDGKKQQVTRIGPFAVFTSDGAQFLDYKLPDADAGDNAPFLTKLPSQPGGQITSAASKVASAAAGDVVYAPLDPTRGQLLKSFERVPTFYERHWVQGGNIGKFIIIMAALGVLFGIFNIIRLFFAKMAINGQKRKAQPSKSNALGRVMMAYEGSQNKDADTVELKLDEAILRESPKFEFGLNILKLLAGVAPLLGLLGTVTGMIQTFQAMMIYGTGDPQLMAGGISVALVTTMLGLYAAIPLLVLHSFCASIARSIQGTLEEQSAGIVARHVETRGMGSGSSIA